MLTEEMVYEMNRSASQSYGLDNPYTTHHYPLEKDMESWKSDKYRYKVKHFKFVYFMCTLYSINSVHHTSFNFKLHIVGGSC